VSRIDSIEKSISKNEAPYGDLNSSAINTHTLINPVLILERKGSVQYPQGFLYLLLYSDKIELERDYMELQIIYI